MVIDGFNGYLFEAGNSKELIEKITLLENEDTVRTMGMNSRRVLEDTFAPSMHFGALMKVFNKVRK